MSAPSPEKKRIPRRVVAIAVGVLLVAAAVWFAWRAGFDPASAAAWLRSTGQAWWAPLAFIGLYTIFNVFAVPGTILTLTAAVVWGWKVGGLWVLTASTIGSVAPYLLARVGGRRITEAIRRRAGRLSAILENEGFTTLLLLRLIPIVPYNLLNYAAGLAGIRTRDYVLATFFGTIPGIFIVTYSADAIVAGLASPRQAFVRILLAGILLSALVLTTRWFGGRVRRRVER
ncbi:MAG: TVP38/TMEM64 family protein [Thermoanaerobaculia bacterium]